ncbi:hypothetical protein ACEYXF_09995 [Streptomyces asiaticus]|uniref:hypothetical protein n=1 Tax=Streptomyces asiaticus TaxID=114695 RepID=UPI0039BDDE58
MLEQLPHRDVTAIDALAPDEPRQVLLDRRVEADAAFADQLQDDQAVKVLVVDPMRTRPSAGTSALSSRSATPAV